MSDQLLKGLLPRRMSYNIRQAAPYIITFLVAFGLSLIFWRAALPPPEQRYSKIAEHFKAGKKVIKVAEISKDLNSQLEYIHEQNGKLHRARNLAIDKMLELQQEKDEISKTAQEHKERADQLGMALQQSRGQFQDMKSDLDRTRAEVARMQELQRIMEEEHQADEHLKRQLATENETLKNKLVSGC